MTQQDKEQLKLEIDHIFESGANEIRIFEMVVNFIDSRNGVNKNMIIMEKIKIMEEKSCRDCIYSEILSLRDGRTETTCHYSKPSKVVVRPCSKFTKMGKWEGEK